MSYLDNREQHLEHILKSREERLANKPEVDPVIAGEVAEQRAEKQARIEAQLAIGARRLAGDPEILAQDAAQAAERQREAEERAAEPDPISTEPDYY